jgi:hypothetical protein
MMAQPVVCGTGKLGVDHWRLLTPPVIITVVVLLVVMA